MGFYFFLLNLIVISLLISTISKGRSTLVLMMTLEVIWASLVSTVAMTLVFLNTPGLLILPLVIFCVSTFELVLLATSLSFSYRSIKC